MAPIDLSVEDSCARVARDLAHMEADPAAWDRFMPRLRISVSCPPAASLPGRGPGEVTLFNCFVMGTIPTAWRASSSR